MTRPQLLEGCACEGGATAGYQRAGWHVTAVDLDANRLKYNPADEVVHGDAIKYLLDHADDDADNNPTIWAQTGNEQPRAVLRMTALEASEDREDHWERIVDALENARRLEART